MIGRKKRKYTKKKIIEFPFEKETKVEQTEQPILVRLHKNTDLIARWFAEHYNITNTSAVNELITLGWEKFVETEEIVGRLKSALLRQKATKTVEKIVNDMTDVDIRVLRSFIKDVLTEEGLIS